MTTMAVKQTGQGWFKRAGMLVLVSLPIVGLMYVEFPMCPTAAFFGLPCPGCGLTRASLALGHGHIIEALRLHPLVWLVAPLYGWLVVNAVYGFVRGTGAGPGAGAAVASAEVRERALRTDRALTKAAWVVVVLLVGVWLARFLGAFGGPVPVTTFAEWRASQAEAPAEKSP